MTTSTLPFYWEFCSSKQNKTTSFLFVRGGIYVYKYPSLIPSLTRSHVNVTAPTPHRHVSLICFRLRCLTLNDNTNLQQSFPHQCNQYNQCSFSFRVPLHLKKVQAFVVVQKWLDLHWYIHCCIHMTYFTLASSNNQ